jgi:Cd2+/Zn2+-exporting ATPase
VNQGYLEVRATTAGTGTMLQKIVALLERAQGEKTRSQTMIESFVKFYTPIVLLCALIYGVVCGQTNDGEDDCVKAALVVLILACPCALVAAAPSPIAFGTAAAVRGGAVIKSPQAFEDLAAYVEPLPSFHYVALARPSLTSIGALHQLRSPEGRLT